MAFFFFLREEEKKLAREGEIVSCFSSFHLSIADKMATIAVIGDDAARQQDVIASKQVAGEFMIKPDSTGAKLSTDQWPLLLKNYVSAKLL